MSGQQQTTDCCSNCVPQISHNQIWVIVEREEHKRRVRSSVTQCMCHQGCFVCVQQTTDCMCKCTHIFTHTHSVSVCVCGLMCVFRQQPTHWSNLLFYMCVCVCVPVCVPLTDWIIMSWQTHTHIGVDVCCWCVQQSTDPCQEDKRRIGWSVLTAQHAWLLWQWCVLWHTHLSNQVDERSRDLAINRLWHSLDNCHQVLLLSRIIKEHQVGSSSLMIAVSKWCLSVRLLDNCHQVSSRNIK